MGRNTLNNEVPIATLMLIVMAGLSLFGAGGLIMLGDGEDSVRPQASADATECVDRFNESLAKGSLRQETPLNQLWVALMKSRPEVMDAEMIQSGDRCLLHATFGGSVGATGATEFYYYSDSPSGTWTPDPKSRPSVGSDGEGTPLDFSENGISEQVGP